ncbi:methionine adenosyltransferase [Ornithobacterium rhinotracheale]|uniref:methionine adenosyltransferase n=1 Tax=Ornithobacterium rhinotracheale TaxID=28251 RepID=UPI0040362A72
MSYFFTSESVSEGHPDKVADQISDAILDHFLAFDSQSKVACETLVTTGQVILAGEVNSKAYVDLQEITRKVIGRIGYNDSQMNFTADSCGVLSAIHEQSPDIRQGVVQSEKENQGAGDQGMMFGYATNETENFMPLALDLSHRILLELADIRKNGTEMPYLRPDAKAQITLEYSDDNKPTSIHTIVVSTQHDEFGDERAMQERIRRDVIQIVIPRVIQKLPTHIKELFTSDITYHINPTGKFVIGGPHGDTGLTGRKIIVDTYGGKGAHGGGAFSGKDPSKVDRSAAYAMRHLAKNLVAAGVCEEALVQVSYAIGVAEPMSLCIETYGTSKVDLSDAEIAQKLLEKYDFRPYAIEEKFKLRNPIYEETAAYGHMGREPRTVKKVFEGNGRDKVECEVELFTWEKLDIVDELKALFELK